MSAQTKSAAWSSYADSSSPFSASGGNQTALRAEEKALALFQPDILAKSQYLANSQRRLHLEPERKLMLAVLEDAISCFQRYATASHPKGRALFAETEEWILEEDRLWLFSFENVCDALGFDSEYLRAGLMRWKEREQARHRTTA